MTKKLPRVYDVDHPPLPPLRSEMPHIHHALRDKPPVGRVTPLGIDEHSVSSYRVTVDDQHGVGIVNATPDLTDRDLWIVRCWTCDETGSRWCNHATLVRASLEQSRKLAR